MQERETITLLGERKNLPLDRYFEAKPYPEIAKKYQSMFQRYILERRIQSDPLAYIDQRDLFNRYCKLEDYASLFSLLTHNPQAVVLRTGDPYLEEVIRTFQHVHNQKFYKTHNAFHKTKYILSLFIKLVASCVGLILLFANSRASNKRLRVCFLTSANSFKDSRCDYRIHNLVKSCDRNKALTILFIRTNHGPVALLRNLLRRRRLSIYTDSFNQILTFISKCKPHKYYLPIEKAQAKRVPISENLEQRVVFYRHESRMKAALLAKSFYKWLYNSSNIDAVIGDISERSIFEIIGANSSSSQTYGFQNGTEFKYFMLQKFVRTKTNVNISALAQRNFIVWNKSWANYYLDNGNTYDRSSILINGYYRGEHIDSLDNIRKSISSHISSILTSSDHRKVLWLIENENNDLDTCKYLENLLINGMSVEFKCRPQSKDVADQTSTNLRTMLRMRKYDLDPLLSETDQTIESLDMSKYSVAVGSYTTGLIDCLAAGLPVVIFKSDRWGDCFDLLRSEKNHSLICSRPADLAQSVTKIGLNYQTQHLLAELLLPVHNPSLCETFVRDLTREKINSDK